jgi:carboxymethylenebutenolidase
MNERMLTLTAADGFTLDAFRATPANPRGGLVVLQEIFGLGEQMKSVVRAFAAQGYDAIAPALFDRVSPRTVVPYEEAERGRAIMLKLEVEQVMLDVAAAVEQVDGGRGVTVLGYCWGGGMALRAAGQMRLAGAVAYYGTGLDKHTLKGAPCPVLLHFGATDTLATPEMAALVKQRIPQAEVYSYAAGHAFANAARSTYVAAAADLAWERTLAFLRRVHPA